MAMFTQLSIVHIFTHAQFQLTFPWVPGVPSYIYICVCVNILAVIFLLLSPSRSLSCSLSLSRSTYLYRWLKLDSVRAMSVEQACWGSWKPTATLTKTTTTSTTLRTTTSTIRRTVTTTTLSITTTISKHNGGFVAPATALSTRKFCFFLPLFLFPSLCLSLCFKSP